MTILEGFGQYEGTKEYDGIVAEIQTWFYGKMKRDAWCATSESYFANRAGVLDQLGGKNEGVREMYEACRKAHAGGRVYEYGRIPETIPEGAVLFFLRNGASHVTNANETRKYDRYGYIACLGGNQDDAIKVKNYHMGNLEGIFIPDYGDPTRPVVKRGYKDSEQGGTYCATIQKALNELINAGLIIDGSCGPATESAIKSWQKSMKAKGVYTSIVDGHFGPRSWAALDAVHPVIEDGYLYRPSGDLWARP